MIQLKISDHIKYPGPRYKKLGPSSGEYLRDDIIWPLLSVDRDLAIEFDAMGYASSFLHEAFFGLVERYNLRRDDVQFLSDHLVCNNDPSIVDEVREYLEDALNN